MEKRFLFIVFLFGTALPAAGQSIDIDRWQRLKVGMTQAEVVTIMGKPRSRDNVTLNFEAWNYFTVVAKNEVFPSTLAYRVWMTRQAGTFSGRTLPAGAVLSIESPVCGGIPKSGIPGKPEIFLPLPGSRFTHYPRIFDVRWCIPAGELPLEYELELDWAGADERFKKNDHFDDPELKTKIPYISFSWPAMSKGRARVRAANKLGSGPWSEYVEFEFTK